MQGENNNYTPESKIRKVLFHEATIIIGIVMGVFSYVMYVIMPMHDVNSKIELINKDISTINTNHLTHLQNYAEEIKELKKSDTECRDKMNTMELEISSNITKILTLLKQ